MIARSDSFLGLARHEATLGARAFWSLLGHRSTLSKILILVAVLVCLHVIASSAAHATAPYEIDGRGAAFLAAATRTGTLFVLPWTIASTMSAVTRMLYQRGDLDLLLSSPISSRKLVAVRLLGLAIEAVGSVAMLLLPFANANALQGRPHWLALYPALAAAGLAGSGIGLALALGLFTLVGPRRARVVSQIVATLVGASAVVAAQLIAVLPSGAQTALFASVSSPTGGANALLRLLTTPERAASGDVRAILAWLAVASAIFLGSIVLFGDAFVTAAMRSAGAPATQGRSRAKSRFRIGLGAAMRVKEHRLLWRDPWLISQMMLQALYTLPVGLALWKNGGVTGSAGIAFGPTLVVIAGQLSGSLAWIALSAEDAPEFLATAPATRGQIERAKLAAVAFPVALAMTAPMLALAWASPWGAFCAVGCAIGAGLSGVLLMLWRQAPARRGMVLRRHSASKLVALGEHWLSLLWAMATGIAALGSATFLVPVALVALTMMLVRPARVRQAMPAPLPANP